MAYTPTQEDLNTLLSMLTDSATGNNSKQVNDQLLSYASNPNFSLLLCTVFASAQPCVSNALPLDWTTYRAVGGLALKTAMANKKTVLSDAILVTTGQATTQVLQTSTEAMIIRTAAQIYSRITARVGRIDWWATSVGTEMSQLLLGTLLNSSNPSQVKAALYALQYLLEDAANQIGEASEVIISSIADFAVTQSPDVRRHCFALICQVYELGVDADWDVDTFSPMQLGLCNSSYRVALFATQMAQTEAVNDAVLMRDVLSCFSTLIDYMEYFVSAPGLNLESVAKLWLETAVRYIVTPTDDQVTTAALDFIVKIVAVFERTNGEGPIIVLYNALTPLLIPTVRALFPLMVMKEEEERSRLQSDHYTVRDVHRSQSNIKKTFGDEASTSADGDEVAMSVRKSASMCLDHLCRLDCDAVFPSILEVCLTKWDDADWHYREVAILCLGAAVHGAFAQLDPYFAEFVPKIISSIKAGTSQHVCITSMAAWAGQRMSVWLLTAGKSFVPAFLEALLGNFVCESKRVQSSCVTAVRFLFMTATALGEDAALAPFFPNIAQTIVTCVPHYHTTNLKYLCDLTIDLLSSAPNPESAAAIIAPFTTAFAAKFGRLGETFHAYYNAGDSGNNNVVVETDVFDIARVVYTYYQSFATPEDVFQHLSAWIGMLGAVATGSHTDDPELSEQPTRLMSMLLTTLPSNVLAAFSQTAELGQCVAWLLQHPSTSVQGAACALLSDMIAGFGASVYSFVPAATIVGYLTPLVTPTTNLNVLIDASRTIKVMASTSVPQQQLQPLVTSLSLCLRSDVYESTREGHCQLASDLCSILPTMPSAAPLSALTVVADLLHGLSNDYTKYENTIAFCAVLVSPQGQQVVGAGGDALQGFLHSFYKMVFSWQKMSEGQCQQAIAAAISTLMGGFSQQSWAVLSTNPEGYVRDIMGHYGLQL